MKNKKFEEEFKKSFPYQLDACRLIEKTWNRDKPHLPCNFFYIKEASQENGASYDLAMILKDETSAIAVELETGETLPYWTDTLPLYRWPNGATVPQRKCHPGRYDVFIKFSMTQESFFAATWPYIAKVGRRINNLENCLQEKFKNNDFVGIFPEYLVNDGKNTAHDDYDALWNLLAYQLSLKRKGL